MMFLAFVRDPGAAMPQRGCNGGAVGPQKVVSAKRMTLKKRTVSFYTLVTLTLKKGLHLHPSFILLHFLHLCFQRQ